VSPAVFKTVGAGFPARWVRFLPPPVYLLYSQWKSPSTSSGRKRPAGDMSALPPILSADSRSTALNPVKLAKSSVSLNWFTRSDSPRTHRLGNARSSSRVAPEESGSIKCCARGSSKASKAAPKVGLRAGGAFDSCHLRFSYQSSAVSRQKE